MSKKEYTVPVTVLGTLRVSQNIHVVKLRTQ
jgi:hypothetical protein